MPITRGMAASVARRLRSSMKPASRAPKRLATPNPRRTLEIVAIPAPIVNSSAIEPTASRVDPKSTGSHLQSGTGRPARPAAAPLDPWLPSRNGQRPGQQGKLSPNFFIGRDGTNPFGRSLANMANSASFAVIGSRYVPDPADFLCGYAALCSGRHRLGPVPADPVRRRSPVGNGVGVFARGLELPRGAGEERGRARSLVIRSGDRSNVGLKALPAVNAQHLAKDVARTVAA